MSTSPFWKNFCWRPWLHSKITTILKRYLIFVCIISLFCVCSWAATGDWAAARYLCNVWEMEYHLLTLFLHVDELPNAPYLYVFRQLSLKFSQVHRSPLKSFQSEKVETTVVWGSCERKFRSSTCRWSNLGLPYPSLVHPAVLEMFMKVLNIPFFPITLYSLRFVMQTTKLTTVSIELCFRELFSCDLWPTNRFNFANFHVQTINKLKT